MTFKTTFGTLRDFAEQNPRNLISQRLSELALEESAIVEIHSDGTVTSSDGELLVPHELVGMFWMTWLLTRGFLGRVETVLNDHLSVPPPPWAVVVTEDYLPGHEVVAWENAAAAKAFVETRREEIAVSGSRSECYLHTIGEWMMASPWRQEI